LLVVAVAVLICGGCRSEDAVGTSPESTTTPEAKQAATEATVPDRGDKPLRVDLELEGLSPLYKGFFSQQSLLQTLAGDLAPHIANPSVTVKVVWNETDKAGTIQMLVPEGEAPLAATGPTFRDDRSLDPAPLAPYYSALEAYRAGVGERYDLRVLSFGLALEMWDSTSECRCLWPAVRGEQGGLVPGPRITCREPLGGTLELTQDGEAWPSRLKGSRKARKVLAGALGL